MSRTYRAAARASTASAVEALPAHYAPLVAGYANGPYLDPETVTPTNWRWRNTRTYIVRSKADGQDYRALRVTDEEGGHFVGYWAIELMGQPLTLGAEFDAEREQAVERHAEKIRETNVEERRQRTRNYHA